MQVIIPDGNPIGFYRYNQVPDWVTYWPNYRNTTHRVEYFPGMHATEYYEDFVINNEISLQLWLSLEGTENLSLYKFDESTESYSLHATVTPVAITPTGWVSEKVNRYNYTPTSTGVYYFESTTAGIRSHKFVVYSSLKFKKRVIKIDYSNSENDFDMVFDNDGTSVYSPTVFLTGTITPDSPGNDISAFITDRGDISKQRGTPVPVVILKITDVHFNEIDKVNIIASMDTLTVNGITYQNQEGPEVEPIENSDLVNINIKLRQKNYTYSK